MRSGPKIATNTKKPTMHTPAATLRLVVARRHAPRSRPRTRPDGVVAAAATNTSDAAGGRRSFPSTGAGGMGSSGDWLMLGAPFLANAGVEERVHEIHDQVHHDGGDNDKQQHAVRQGVVLPLDR